MLSTRAPLYSVSIAFAIGCVLGLDDWFALSFTLGAWVVSAIIWILCGRWEWRSLLAFYGFVICTGLVHTLLMVACISINDVRRLPEEKTFDSTQWRGTIEGAVQSIPVNTNRHAQPRISFILDVQAWRPTGGRLYGADIDLPWQPANGKIRCTLVGPQDDLGPGDQIEFAAAVTPFSASLNPGELDRQEWEAQQGIYNETSISPLKWTLIARVDRSLWQDFAGRAQDWTYHRLQLGLEDDPDTANFLAGMLIGDRQKIPAGIEDKFRRTGTLHVFAVSGQNIAVMLIVVMTVLQLAGLVRWRWAWTLAPLVLTYCILTGSPASAIRATVMALAFLVAWKLGRPLPALSCWAVAFLVMMIWSPPMLLDPGAQLSFGVVLGLILLGPPLMRLIGAPFHPDPFLPRDLLRKWQRREETFWRWLCGLLASGLAATFVCEPIAAIDFHQITPISVLANLVVIPIAGAITIIGTIGITFSLVNTTLASLCNNTNWLLAKLLIGFVGFLAHEPGAAMNVPDLRTQYLPPPSFVIMAAQDSASLLVRTADGAWLVNAGKESLEPTAVSRLLQFYGINRLNGLILAQIGVPENGGVEKIVQDFKPRHLAVPALPTRSPLQKRIDAFQGQPMELWPEGRTEVLGPGIAVEVLHPALNSTETKAEDRALVLLFHAGGQTVLWAGKVGAKVQEEILAKYPRLHADVLVMGVDHWPEEAWLQALQPRHWLQIPSRANQVETNVTVASSPDFPVWALDKTGAVEVRFLPAQAAEPPKIQMHLWRQEPGPE